MAINQTIHKFIQVAGDRDFARNNLYRVMSCTTRGLTLKEDDLMYCKGAEIPARSTPVSTSAKYMGMTAPFLKSTVQYEGNEDYTLTFYLDGKSELRTMFERASRINFNDLTSTGDWRFAALNQKIVLAQVNEQMEVIKYVHFYGVNLHKVDAIQVDMTGDGDALEVKVHFSYIFYTEDGSNTVATL